jgi:hypothetical protein
MEETRDDLAAIGVDVSELEVQLSRLEKSQTGAMSDNSAYSDNNIVCLDHNRQTELHIDGMYLSASHLQRNSKLVTFSEKKLQEITDWLSQLDFDQKQHNIISNYTAETGNWFLEEPKFQSWLRGEFNTLWCPGNGEYLFALNCYYGDSIDTDLIGQRASAKLL